MAPRDSVLRGSTRRIHTGCGNLYITINHNEGNQPIEVFVRLGKAGGCASSQTEALGRLITLALRANIDISTIVDQLRGIGCHQPTGFGSTKILSCADAVAKALDKGEDGDDLKAISEIPVSKLTTPEILASSDLEDDIPHINHEKVFKEVAAVVKVWNAHQGACPDCGAALAPEEGCMKCHCCGYTKC